MEPTPPDGDDCGTGSQPVEMEKDQAAMNSPEKSQAPKESWRLKLEQYEEEGLHDELSKEIKQCIDYAIESEAGIPQYKGTGFIYDELFTSHECEWDPDVPEFPQRIVHPFHQCLDLELVNRCVRIPVKPATEDMILWQHSQKHLQLAKETASMSLEQRKELAEKYEFWYSNEATYECALAAAGSCIELMDQIINGKVTNGFAMVRPGGHHAMPDAFSGYCVFNNVALAATHALKSGLERILIVDLDSHHGQSTQHMFYDDPRVMYFSIHRYDYGLFWPHLRESDYDYIGEGEGKGYNINVPLNEIDRRAYGDSDHLAIVQQLLMPLAYEFNPQVVVVSCGFGVTIGDEKGETLVSPYAYGHSIHMLSGLCEGHVCVVLEGGYCVPSITQGCVTVLQTLLGDPCPQLPPLPEPSNSVVSSILNVIKVLRPYWHCFKSFEILDDGQLCPFADVNTSPPRIGFRERAQFDRIDNKFKAHFTRQSDLSVRQNRKRFLRWNREDCEERARHRTCFVSDKAMMTHKNMSDSTHPERPKRLSSVSEKLEEWNLLSRCHVLKSRVAKKSEVLLAHSEQYYTDLEETAKMPDEVVCQRPQEKGYRDVYMCQETFHCAMLAVGCLLEATESVGSRRAQNGVALIRPPGHLAERSQAKGFCFLNNVAIAAAYAMAYFSPNKILIVDWDIHHGIATQRAFYNDSSVLYISLHRFDDAFFSDIPEGDTDYIGRGQGVGFNVNIPWPKGKIGSAEYIAAFHRIVMPIAYEFAPDLVIVSAGFDAAVADMLGGCKVSPQCFGHLTHMLSSLASGRVIVALEGGYSAEALSLSMATCMAVLLGDPCPPLELQVPDSSAQKAIWDVLQVQKQIWKSLKFAEKVPPLSRFKPGDKDISGDQSGCESFDFLARLVAFIREDVRRQSTQAAKTAATSRDSSMADKTEEQTDQASEAGKDAGPSGTAGASGDEQLGACGGSWRPNTLADVAKIQGVDTMYAVQPASWCPHLKTVQPLPEKGLNTDLPCEECGNTVENWVCLVCYKVFCSRYVKEHMLLHSADSEHLMVLSYADLSVWCYACNDYIDNEVVFPMKNAAHTHKFGESLPNVWKRQ